MNNFNKVFGVVKNVCGGDVTSVDAISKQVNMHYDRLEFYINCLSEVGLIEYCATKKEVKLTESGKTSETVFTN